MQVILTHTHRDRQTHRERTPRRTHAEATPTTPVATPVSDDEKGNHGVKTPEPSNEVDPPTPEVIRRLLALTAEEGHDLTPEQAVSA